MHINVELKLGKESEEQIKEVVIAEANRLLIQDKSELQKLVKECVKKIISNEIANILQTKDYRTFLRNKIAKEIGIVESEQE